MINLDNSNVSRTLLIPELAITLPPATTGILALCLRFTLGHAQIVRTKERSLSLKTSIQFSLQNRGKIAIFIKVDFVFQVSNSKPKNARLHTSGVSSKIARASANRRHLSFLRAVWQFWQAVRLSRRGVWKAKEGSQVRVAFAWSSNGWFVSFWVMDTLCRLNSAGFSLSLSFHDLSPQPPNSFFFLEVPEHWA